MKVTIADVARLAGVGKSTVSRYLNGGYVSEENRKILDRVIKETKYVPNSFAQSLKAKKTNLIGVSVPRINSFATSLLLKGIDDSLRELGLQMLISNTNQKIEREIESLYSFANQKVAGIILVATEIRSKHLQAIKKIETPVLIVGQETQEVPAIIYDDEKAGYLIGRHMSDLGHQNLIYLGVDKDDIAVGVKRYEGFLKGIAGKNCNHSYYESTFLMEDAYELFSKIIESGEAQSKTAVVCATDNIALGVMKATRKHGIKIPEDLSVTGFGDYEIADLMGLTTVFYPYQETGRLAAKKIATLEKNENFLMFTTGDLKLVSRESVANIS